MQRWEYWPLFGLFFVACLWVGVVPKALANEPGKPVAKVLRVQAEGEWRATHEKARESALEAAQKQLHAVLLAEHPPVSRVPELDAVRGMVVSWSPPEQHELTTEEKETLFKYTVLLEVKSEHLRLLRKEERSADAGWFLGGVAALFAFFTVLFRVDEWTRGFLTRWLILAAVGATALLLGIWLFIA